MPHTNDHLFQNATQIAERRIRTARALQSREVARMVWRALTWLVSRVKAAETASASQQ